MMELSKDTMEGVTNVLNTSIVADDNFSQILDTAASQVCDNTVEAKCKYPSLGIVFKRVVLNSPDSFVIIIL